MKNLTLITASFTMLLASCGDKTQFSGTKDQNTTPSPTPRVSETSSEETPVHKSRQASGKEDSSEDIVASLEPAQVSSSEGTAIPPTPAPSQNRGSEPVGTTAPQTPSQAPKPPLEAPANTPAVAEFKDQAQAAIEKSVLSLQQTSGGTLNGAQAQSLTVGLTAMVGNMAQGPLQGPAALADLVDLIKNVKGLKAAAPKAAAVGLPVGLPNLPVNLPVNIPALADAAVLADLAAALGDLAAAAADLDIAGVVAAIQDLIALIMDLIA